MGWISEIIADSPRAHTCRIACGEHFMLECKQAQQHTVWLGVLFLVHFGFGFELLVW